MRENLVGSWWVCKGLEPFLENCLVHVPGGVVLKKVKLTVLVVKLKYLV